MSDPPPSDTPSEASHPRVRPGDPAADQSDVAAARAEASGRDDGLQTSLTALSQLATARMELTDVLTNVARFAVVAIPGADGAGLTLLESGHHDTIVASAPFVGQVDAIQYGLGEGPCITAAAESRTLRSGSLEREPAWPRFGRRVASMGVHSALSVPLLTAEGVLGAMNIYARAHDAFDEHAAQVGELFAVPAAIAVQNAQVLAQARRLAAQLQTALANRATIDQAIGIVMSRVGCDEGEAFDRLRHMSQGENLKLHAVAGRIVHEAVRRARLRHTDS